MKIAVTYNNGEIFQHFGHTEFFKIYEISDKKVINSEIVPTLGSGHGALATFLSMKKVDVLICGGIGTGAQSALANAGIILFGGVKGFADDAINAYLSGKLIFNPDVKCDHHNHEHSCGSHDCSDHSCNKL